MSREDIKIAKIGDSYYKLEPIDSDSMNPEYNMYKIDAMEAIEYKIKNIESSISKLINSIEYINEKISNMEHTLYPGDGFGVIE